MAIGNTPVGNMIIKVDLDSTGFNNSMTGLKRQMKAVNSELKASLSQFGRSEQSVDKYGKQIDILTKRHEIQGKAVEQASKDYKDMVAQHGEGSAKAEEYGIKLNEQIALFEDTGRQIEDLKGSMGSLQREQDIQNSGWHKAGDYLQTFSGKMADVSQFAMDVGGKLTNYITKPIVGIGIAAGGLTGKLGFDRLVETDSANAKLEGLGYNTKEIGSISDTVTTAIKGGMTTYAEGVNIAAGAMAAGVEEGEDLENYIGLVGDAAIGSGRPVDEMAQIFNRVEGSGKLMTQELQQIEHGMPGFGKAMADHLGVPPEKMQEMVTAGEVSSEDFLTVMDDFAGGMAEAHAKSWSGMVANAKNYIGQIGEAFLDGTFQDAKDKLADFIAYMETDEAMEKAEEMGEKFRSAMNKIGRAIKSVIDWYMNLSDGQKDLVNKAALAVVALGPLLTIFGKLGMGISKTADGLGVFFKWLAPIMTPVKKLATPLGTMVTSATKGGGAFKILGRVLSVLSGPVGIVVGVITTLVGIITTAYKKSDTFREAVAGLVDSFKGFYEVVKDWVQPAIEAVKEFIGEMRDKIAGFIDNEGAGITEAWDNIWQVIGTVLGWITDKITWAFENVIQPVIEFVMKVVGGIVSSVWKGIKNTISGALDIIMGAFQMFSGLFTGDWEKMWEGVKTVFFGILDVIKGFFQMSFIGVIIDNVKDFAKEIPSWFSKAWTWVKEDLWEKIKEITGIIFDWLLELPGKIWEATKNLASSLFGWLTDAQEQTDSKFSEWWEVVWGWLKELPGKLWEGTKTLASKLVEWIGAAIGYLNEKQEAFWGAVWEWLKELPGRLWEGTKTLASKLVEWIGAAREYLQEKQEAFWGAVWEWLKELPGKVWEGTKALASKLVEWISAAREYMQEKTDAFWAAFWEWLKSLPGKIWEGTKSLASKLVEWIGAAREYGLEKLGQWWEVIWEWLKGLPEKIWEGTKSLVKTFTKWIVQAKDYGLEKLGELWTSFKEWLVNLPSKMKETLYEKLDVFSSWISKMWEGTKEALSNLWENIKGLFNTGIETVVDLYKNSFVGKIIKKATELGSSVSKKISEMWTKVKTYFSESITEAWENLKNSFVGRIIRKIIEFVSNFKENISKLWTAVKEKFKQKINEVWANLKNSFVGRIIKKIIEFVKNFKENISEMWASLKKKFKTKINEVWTNLKNSFVGRIIKKIIEFVKDFKKNISDMWASLKRKFKQKIKEIFNAIKNSFVGDIIRSVTDMKDKFVGIAGDMWDGVKSKFDDIVAGAKALPGRIKKGIKSTKDKAMDGMKSVGNTLIKWAGKPYNKVIDGVNWITGKLGIDKDISGWDWEAKQFAHGTGMGGHSGGNAILGDGVGTNAGSELVQLPTGQQFLSEDRPTMYPNLPKGTEVLSATNTREYFNTPMYAKGTTGLGGWIKNSANWVSDKGKKAKDFAKEKGQQAWEGTKKGYSKVKDSVSDVWDYAKNPSKLINKFLDVIDLGTGDMAKAPKDMIKGGFKTLKGVARKATKNFFKEAEEADGVGKPNFKYPITSKFGRRWGRNHNGVDFGFPHGTHVKSQTNGSVTHAGWNSGGYGNLVTVRNGPLDILYAHLSKVMKSVGDGVSKGQIIGKSGNTGNSTGPHLHYEVRKNGKPVDPMKLGSAGKGTDKYRGVAKKALKMEGQFSNGNLDALMMQMQSESGGNPQAINMWDSNARRGTPSKGLMQVIDPTFQAHKRKGYGSIWKPLDNILASIRYATSRYGSLKSAYRGVGYKQGTPYVPEDQLALLHKGEAVIPREHNMNAGETNNTKLLALSGKQSDGISSKKQSKHNNALLEATLEQNKLLTQLLEKSNPDINQTNHYHNTGELSPSETARKNKKMLRKLGMEF